MISRKLSLSLALAVFTNQLPLTVTANTDNKFEPNHVEVSQIGVNSNNQEMTLTIPKTNDLAFYRKILMTERERGGDTDKLVEQTRLFAISRIKRSPLFNYDPAELSGRKSNRFDTIEKMIDGVSTLIGISSALQPETLPAALGLSATLKIGQGSLKYGPLMYETMYEMGDINGLNSKMPLPAAAEAIMADLNACAERCDDYLTFIGQRYNLDTKNGEFPAAVVVTDDLANLRGELSELKDQMAFQKEAIEKLAQYAKQNANNIGPIKSVNPDIEKLRVEIVREQALLLEDQLLHRALSSTFALASTLIANDTEKRHFGAIANMTLGIYSAKITQLSSTIQLKALKTNNALVEKLGPDYVSSAEKSINVNLYLTCALLVYNAYSEWQNSNDQNGALSAISQQLGVIDQKLTNLLNMSAENFKSIQLKLNEVFNSQRAISQMQILHSYRNSEVIESLKGVRFRKTDLLNKIESLIHYDPENKYFQYGSLAEGVLEKDIYQLQVDPSSVADVFSDAIEIGDRQKVGEALSMLVKWQHVAPDNRAFDESALLLDYAIQIFKKYKSDLTRPNAKFGPNEIAAPQILEQALKEIAEIPRAKDLPNLAVWFAFMRGLSNFSKSNLKEITDRSLNQATTAGLAIQSFYDKTTNSSYFQSALRYSLTRAMTDMIEARNRLWHYSLYSYGIIGSEKDRIDLSKAPNWSADLPQRFSQTPNQFIDLKTFQLAKIALVDGGQFSLIRVNPSATNSARYQIQFNLTSAKLKDGTNKFAPYELEAIGDRVCHENRTKTETCGIEPRSDFAAKAVVTSNYSSNANGKRLMDETSELAYTAFAREVGNGLPFFNTETDKSNEVYYFDTIDHAAKSLNSENAKSLATRFYMTVDRYLFVYYTYKAFTDLQNMILGSYNLRCAGAFRIDGIEPNSVLAKLQSTAEVVDLNSALEKFKNQVYDRSTRKFVCRDPGPIGIKVGLKAIEEIRSRKHSWF